MRKYLDSVVKISQMLPGNVDGTGQGGDRCEPTCATIIDCSLLLGPDAKSGKAPELIMEDIARWRNGGALSGPPEGPWLGDWLVQISGGAVYLQEIPSTPEAIQASIDAGNMIYTGLDDYSAQRLVGGGDPYNWPENEHAGHVEIVAGYDDTDGFAPLVHDPLRGTAGQPAAYSWQSMLNAGLHLYRVVGPVLSSVVSGGSFAGTGGDGMALIQHPTNEMRLDLIYVGTDGNIWHNWNNNDGLQGLAQDAPTHADCWGNPGTAFAPLTAGATWDAQGTYLNVVAATPDGAIWAHTRRIIGGTFDTGWLRVTGQAVLLPTGGAGTPGPAGPPGPAYDDTPIKARLNTLETLFAKIKAIFA